MKHHACEMRVVECPLLAQSGHSTTEFQCPLLGVKRTFLELVSMSAFDPKRTSADVATCPLLLGTPVSKGGHQDSLSKNLWCPWVFAIGAATAILRERADYGFAKGSLHEWYSSRHSNIGQGGTQPRVLYACLRLALRQENRELRRPGYISPLLRRLRRPSWHYSHILSLGTRRARPRWRGACARNGVPCPAEFDRLLDASLR